MGGMALISTGEFSEGTSDVGELLNKISPNAAAVTVLFTLKDPSLLNNTATGRLVIIFQHT